MRPEIVITGFPKCGTTALIRTFQEDDDAEVITLANGHPELSWPLIQNFEARPQDAKLRVHKFTAYVYNPKALDFLSKDNDASIAVLCVRNLEKSLISWHRMHQSIANSGRNPEHFAYKERDFYSNCEIPEYYERFARRRLRYDVHLERLLSYFGDKRVVVVSQERMAADIKSVRTYLKGIAINQELELQPPASVVVRHVGYADDSQADIPLEIKNELAQIWQQLKKMIEDTGVRYCH